MNGQKNIIYLLKVIGDRLNASANKCLKASGLTMTQANIIGFLAENGGTSTQKEIEANFDISHPTVVGVIAQLEEQGYITCAPLSNDRRFKTVVLTPKAHEMIEATMTQLRELEESLLTELSADEAQAFRRGIEILYQSVKSN